MSFLSSADQVNPSGESRNGKSFSAPHPERVGNTERLRPVREHQYARYSPLWENAGRTSFEAHLD